MHVKVSTDSQRSRTLPMSVTIKNVDKTSWERFIQWLGLIENVSRSIDDNQSFDIVENMEKGKELESPLDELIKSMKVFQLRFAKLDNVESLSQQKSKEG